MNIFEIHIINSLPLLSEEGKEAALKQLNANMQKKKKTIKRNKAEENLELHIIKTFFIDAQKRNNIRDQKKAATLIKKNKMINCLFS